MAVQILPWRGKIVARRHVPPARVSLLKNCAFELMTRAASIARALVASEQPAILRDARRIKPFIGTSRSAVRPRTTTVPALWPGHKMGAVPHAPRGRGTCKLHPAPTGLRFLKLYRNIHDARLNLRTRLFVGTPHSAFAPHVLRSSRHPSARPDRGHDKWTKPCDLAALQQFAGKHRHDRASRAYPCSRGLSPCVGPRDVQLCLPRMGNHLDHGDSSIWISREGLQHDSGSDRRQFSQSSRGP